VAVGLELAGLGFRYGPRWILRDVSLELHRGAIVSLVGPNGVGKSTLIKCINGILPPTQGQVSVAGRPVVDLSPAQLSRLMGYVPQSTRDAFAFTVFDVVLMGRRPHIGWWVREADIQAVSESLRFMGIEHLAGRYADELSGGERQKVTIARALAQQPQVMLLDEPTSNLDIRHQLEVMHLLRDLAADRGVLIVMAMHDLNLACRFSDRVVMLKDTRVYADGPPHEVLTPPAISDTYGVSARVISDGGEGLQIIPIRPSGSTTVEERA